MFLLLSSHLTRSDAIKGINQSRRRRRRRGKEEVDEEEGGRRLHAFIQASQAGKLGPPEHACCHDNPLPVSLHPSRPPFPPFFFLIFLPPRLNKIWAIFSTACDA